MSHDASTAIHLNDARWSRYGDVWVRGWAYEPTGPVMREETLARRIASSATGFSEIISLLGGNFAAIRKTEGAVLLAVDRVRSIPLFYGLRPGGGWAVSDSARAIAREFESPRVDPASAVELMLQSCVTGSETLIHGLKQVRAGEIVRIENGQATPSRYFRFGSGPVLQDPEAMLIDQATELLADAFDRFIESLDSRPAIVPLSGGLDSRLVVARLAAAGKTDTACFSYGPPFAQETRLSKRVADQLGLPWHRVPYSANKWAQWAASTSFQQFRRDATGLSAIEHEQDWPAVFELKRLGTAPSRAVFVPGHAGDFLGGSHLPSEPDPIEQNAVEWILKKYYVEWPKHDLSASQLGELTRRIDAQITGLENPVAAFASFGWQERQAKMIANSVRVYEHHGFDWALPFWSHPPLLEFWGRVPPAYLRGSHLYQLAARKLLGTNLAGIPTTGHPRTRFSARAHRIFDGGLGRYAIWAGPHPILSAAHTRIRDVVRIGDSTISEAIEPLCRSVASLPVQRVSINALLALGQLNLLTNEPI